MSAALDDLQQMTLLAVARLGDTAYEGSIQEELENVAGRKLSISAIHVTLVRLEKQGMVMSRRGVKADWDPGRRRRYFRLTPKAVTALNATRDSFAGLWDGLELG